MQKPIPTSIQDKILLLKKLETDLGNLPPETFTVNELSKRAFDTNFSQTAAQMEAHTERLFGTICEEMHTLGFSNEEIAAAVNAQLKYDGGPKYCSAAEVAEALD